MTAKLSQADVEGQKAWSEYAETHDDVETVFEGSLLHEGFLAGRQSALRELEAVKAEREWVPIGDIDLPASRCAPFTMIVSFHNEEKCQSIKYVGDYIDDFITYIKPLNAPPPNQPEGGER